jgi:hypothetical protein|tara:strand:- start:795 stop:977 length:183 start_codon:yes stop_codon:yes gene_type:complete
MDNSNYKINENRKNVTGLNRINSVIEYNLKLNLEKRNVSNPAKNSHKSKTTSRLKEMFLT